MSKTTTAPKTTAIDEIRGHIEKMKSGHPDIKIGPGQPTAFSPAASKNDCIRQGDLYLVIREKSDIPKSYVKCVTNTEKDLQVVPDNGTIGSNHRLDSLQGVELYRPADWPNAESLEGPYMVLTEDRNVTHPRHGDVKVLAGSVVYCHYQQNWDEQEKRDRRARD